MIATKYSLTARILHWISAAVIIWATSTGFFLATLDAESALRGFLSFLNVSLTTTFMPVFIFRPVYAARSKKPAMIDMPRWQQTAARTGHLSLYVVTGVVLASGLLMMTHDISLFNLASLPNPVSNAYWNGFFYGVHRYSCMALFLLVGLHLSAVIRHQRAGRNVLARIT
jgi:cytochrome b561